MFAGGVGGWSEEEFRRFIVVGGAANCRYFSHLLKFTLSVLYAHLNMRWRVCVHVLICMYVISYHLDINRYLSYKNTQSIAKNYKYLSVIIPNMKKWGEVHFNLFTKNNVLSFTDIRVFLEELIKTNNKY